MNFEPINSLKQVILFDWVQATFYDEYTCPSDFMEDKVVRIGFTVYDYFMKFFGIKKEDVAFSLGGLFGYNYTYSYGNIKIFTSDRPDMGIHLYMTGTACREYEDLNLNWYSLFEKIKRHNGHYTRVDISIDDFTSNYITITKIRECIKKGEVVSKFKIGQDINTRFLENGEIRSETIWFGSRASRLQIVFYNKYLERKNANYEISEEIKNWFRCECRFRSERADQVIEMIMNGTQPNAVVKGVLSNYVRFCDKSLIDTNRSRWETKDWWLAYLENMESVKLCNKHPEWSIIRKKNWLKKSVSLSQFEVFISDLDNLNLDSKSSEYLYEILKEGFDRIDEDRLSKINLYRRSKHLPMFTMKQLCDYLEDIKMVLIVSDNQFIDE